MIPYAAGIGFAVPARTASWVAAVLIQHGEVRRPTLGIAVRAEELSPEAARAAGHPRAVRVLGVEPGTPAAEARLSEGDLLLEANGNPVDTLDDLQRVLVLSAPPQIELTVLRGNALRRLSIQPRAVA